jgi:hypothetical protein
MLFFIIREIARNVAVAKIVKKSSEIFSPVIQTFSFTRNSEHWLKMNQNIAKFLDRILWLQLIAGCHIPQTIFGEIIQNNYFRDKVKSLGENLSKYSVLQKSSHKGANIWFLLHISNPVFTFICDCSAFFVKVSISCSPEVSANLSAKIQWSCRQFMQAWISSKMNIFVWVLV